MDIDGAPQSNVAPENLAHLEEMHPDIQKYIRFLTWKLMQVIVLHEEGKAFAFDLPEELRSAWRLPARHNDSATY